MDDRDRTIADMNAELERLRRRIAELESGAAPGIYDQGYRLLFENNPLPLWVYDLKTLAFLAVNDAAVRKYGYSREEFLAMTIADIRPREDVPLLLENIAQATEGLDEAGLWRHHRKDGSVIDVEIVSHTLIFEDRKAELVLANDITERRLAEAKMRTIERLYAFLSQINQAIVRTRDRDELFRTICRVAIEFGRFRMAWVGLIEEATGIARPAAHAGREEGYLNILSIGIHDEATGKGPTGSALRKGMLTICDDVATDPRMLPWREEALKRGYRSSAAIPFRLQEKVIGSLNLYAAEPGFFTEDERKLLTEIGVDISFALDTMEGEKERKRTQEALYLKNYVFDVAIAANSIADTNGVIIQANQAFLAIWGYSNKEEVIGKPIPEFLQKADEAAAIIAALHAAGKWEGTYTARKKDGSTFTAFGLATILKDEQGRMIGYQSSVLDITERKRAEEALRESEERYRTLFETMAQGVVYQAPDGRIISANPAAERILGVTIDQMQGRTSMDPRWRAIHEDGSDFPGDQHPAMEALRTGRPVRDTIMGVFHPGRNDYRWILVNAVPEFLPGETRPFQVYATFTDITARRRAEEALVKAKEYAEKLIDTANSIVVGLDVSGNITVFNRAAEAVTGYRRSDLQGRNWFEVIVPRDRFPQVWAEFERLGKGGLPRIFENPIITRSGEERYVVWQNNELFENGRVAGTISFGIDITDRRRAEEALRESEEQYRAIFEGIGDAVFVHRPEGDAPAGRFIAVNDVACRHLGYTREELLSLALPQVDPLDEAVIPSVLESLNAGREAFFETVHIRKDGQRVPVEVRARTIRYLGAPAVLSVVRDISDRKQAEEERQKLIALVENSTDMIGIASLDGSVIYLNDARRQLVGIDSLVDVQRTTVLDYVVPEDVAKTRDEVVPTMLKTGKWTGELRFRHWKTGETVPVEFTGFLINDPRSRKPAFMASISRDITGRKRAEQERLELERRLLHAQKLESLGILAGGIAHDFNNLLMAVLGNLDLSLRMLSPVSPARLNIEQSAQAARRAADLTRQMLAYSGKGSFVVKPMDLSELVEENAHLFRSSVARTTELNVRLDRSLPAITADAGQVQQVIMNLITNASEAIGEDAGRITITTGVRECDARCLKQSRIDDVPPAGRFVMLEVSDTGCGMDAQTQERLFDPFFSTKAPGRGLGMSAMLGIVRGHRGAVFVESSPGRGTSIRILFPALEGIRAEHGAGAGTRLAEAGTRAVNGKILVVDDETIVRNVCKEMIEALGLQVLTAVDGRDAIEVFTKHADDIGLVILDLSMPNMDGMATFKELVRIRPGVKVILCSGFDEQESLRRLSGQGLAGFIQKPYSLEKLRAALENAVRGGG